MKKIFLFFILYGCSQVPVAKPKPDDTLIRLETVFDHVRNSYLRGCVEAFDYLKIPRSFEHCRDEAKIHEKEVREIVAP